MSCGSASTGAARFFSSIAEGFNLSAGFSVSCNKNKKTVINDCLIGAFVHKQKQTNLVPINIRIEASSRNHTKIF